MYHIEKKNSKKIFPEGPRENVWELCENVSPGPAVALDGPAASCAIDLPSSSCLCRPTFV